MKKKFLILITIAVLFSVAAFAREIEYIVRCVDADGTPIAAVELNACTDTFCRPGITDEAGSFSFSDEARAYTVHITGTPEGFIFDPETDFLFEDGNLTIVLSTQD